MAHREYEHALYFKERALSGKSPLSTIAKSLIKA